MIKYLFLSITLLFILFSCSKKTTYEVTGIVKEIHSEDKKLLIDHDIIPGFMEPMVMFFNIHNNVDIEKISIEDSVKFDLVITKNSHYTLNYNILGKSEIQNEEDFLIDENEMYREYKVGEKLNNVNFTKTDNKIFDLSEDLTSKFAIISYIFSRCPMPDMCPAIISHNQYLAKEFPDINFFLISFDYLYDKPEILLHKYGDIEKKYPNITFLSSYKHYNDLVLITKQSNLKFWGIEENNIGHTMRTLVIDKSKKIIKIYDGLDWTPGDIKKDIKNLLNIY